jgi:hypothetical protein
MTGFSPFAPKVKEHGVELRPLCDGAELSRDRVIGQTGQLIFFSRKLGVVARDPVPGEFEERLIEIGFLGFL